MGNSLEFSQILLNVAIIATCMNKTRLILGIFEIPHRIVLQMPKNLSLTDFSPNQ